MSQRRSPKLREFGHSASHTVGMQLNQGLTRPFSDSLGSSDSKGQVVGGLHPPMLMLLTFLLQLWVFPVLSQVGEAASAFCLLSIRCLREPCELCAVPQPAWGPEALASPAQPHT